jgi:hypothetical protein
MASIVPATVTAFSPNLHVRIGTMVPKITIYGTGFVQPRMGSPWGVTISSIALTPTVLDETRMVVIAPDIIAGVHILSVQHPNGATIPFGPKYTVVNPIFVTANPPIVPRPEAGEPAVPVSYKMTAAPTPVDPSALWLVNIHAVVQKATLSVDTLATTEVHPAAGLVNRVFVSTSNSLASGALLLSEVTALSPRWGPSSGGTRVRLYGMNLGPAMGRCRFGGKIANTVETRQSGNSVLCTSPPGMSTGSIPVAYSPGLTTPGFNTAGNFLTFIAPTVTKVVPNVFPSNPQVTSPVLTVFGNNFPTILPTDVVFCSFGGRGFPSVVALNVTARYEIDQHF